MDVFHSLIRSSVHTASVEFRLDGVILEVNPAFGRYLGLPPQDLVDQSLFDFVAGPDRLRSWTQGGPLPEEPVWVNFGTAEGDPFTLRSVVERTDRGLCIVGEPEVDDARSAADALMRMNNELATMARERARRQREVERMREELQETLGELQNSYWHLRKIQEVLPICMECGMVKTDGAEWQSLVSYLKQNEIFISHGFCPDCGKAKLAEYGLE